MGEVVGRMVCPDCGAELTPDLPLGLCPKCLLSSKGTLAESVTGEPEPAKVSDVSSALGAAWRALSAGAAGESGGDVTDEDLRPPEIERYRIIRLLGAGGMGAVYEAEQITPQRIVALKIFRPGKARGGVVRPFHN